MTGKYYISVLYTYIRLGLGIAKINFVSALNLGYICRNTTIYGFYFCNKRIACLHICL